MGVGFGRRPTFPICYTQVMKIQENVVLAPYSTLQIGGPAKYFAEVTNEGELKEALTSAKGKNLQVFILGGGSNVLFADIGFDGLVVRPLMKGREVSPPLPSPYDKGRVGEGILIKVGAGEELNGVVAWTVDSGWWGMENLSFIPGLTGALVIQNVGAYGQEASEIVESVEVFDTQDGSLRTFSKEQCGFTYRHSVFNTSEKGRYMILSVTLRLIKNGKPNISYKDLQSYFGRESPSQSEVREAVIKIRSGKGQDWQALPSAGSFFSNFRLNKNDFDSLLAHIASNFNPDRASELLALTQKIKAPSDDGLIKVPAAWILDNLLGLKGYMHNERVCVSPYHALNLINTGRATASDILDLFKYIRQLTYQKTGLILVNEPEFVGFEPEELKKYFALE